MASHATFSGTSGANDRSVRNLIDIVTKFARDHDPPYSVNYTNKTEMIPRFTRWRSMSVEQKAKVLDLILDAYDSALCNPETDPSAPTDSSFINCSDLRKQSNTFSTELMEGTLLLRERTEDVLGFYFLLNVDALGAFGKNSRDLVKYIHYRVPLIYRNNAALHEHCQLFANALASVVLHRANLTPFRRRYTGQFKSKYQPFLLQPDAQFPYLLPAVDVPYSPIQPLLDDQTLAPTAPNSPGPSHSNAPLRTEDSLWIDASGIDFSSEEVQRALDRAEHAARGSTPYLSGALSSVIEENEFGSEGSGDTSGSVSTPSAVSTMLEFDSPAETYRRIPDVPANPGAPVPNVEGATRIRGDSAIRARYQSFSQPLSFTVSPGCVVITTSGSPATPTRTGRRSTGSGSSMRGRSPSSASLSASPASNLSPLHQQHQVANAPTIRGRRTPGRGSHVEQHPSQIDDGV